jgi:hypothetical protein
VRHLAAGGVEFHARRVNLQVHFFADGVDIGQDAGAQCSQECLGGVETGLPRTFLDIQHQFMPPCAGDCVLIILRAHIDVITHAIVCHGSTKFSLSIIGRKSSLGFRTAARTKCSRPKKSRWRSCGALIKGEELACVA